MTENGGPPDLRRHRLLPPDPGAAADLEVEHHLAELADRLVREGMTPEDARREAERRFGNLGRYRAALESDERRRRRTMRQTEWWSVVAGGVGRAVRSLRRSPGFSAGVVLTLALGIGANAAMFGVLDRLLFQPPVHIVSPDAVRRVMSVGTYSGKVYRQPIGTYPDYLDIKKLGAFTGVAAYSDEGATTLGSGQDATRVKVAMATWNFFPLLGLHAERGRLFAASDDREGATPAAVVSHEYWRAKMGSDPAVLGRTLELAGNTYTVIGVTPPGFTGVDLKQVDVWLPLVTAGVLKYGDGWLHNRDFYWLSAVARLAPGVDVRAAEAQATATLLNARRADIAKGNFAKDSHIALDPLVAARGPQASGESKVARWLGGVSLLVLLIACANVANLLLARGTRRRREVAVRLALGVGRARLVTTMVIESVLLALMGGGVALLLATWGGGLIRKTLLPGVLFPESAVGPRMLAFILIAAVAAGLLAGLGPALQATHADLTGDLAMGAGSGTGRRSWTRSTLTVVQASLSVVLLVGAGLFVRSVSAVRHDDFGLDVNHLVLARIEFETRAMQSSAIKKTSMGLAGATREENQVYEEAMKRLAGMPGVDGVAGTESPFGWGFATRLRVPGRDSIPHLPGGGPYYVDVTPGYFRTAGLKVTSGRVFRGSDDAGAERVAVVSDRMARTLWPHENPLGQCLLVGGSKDGAKQCTTVVGVVEDAHRYGIREDASMTYYMPLAQWKDEAINALYLRTSGDPTRLAAEVAPVLRGLDARIRYATVAPLWTRIDPEARSWTLGATMFSVFGLLALLVAAVGLYGVLAFDVAQRTRELGIRTALGAERGRLLRGVVRDGLRMAVVGILLGLGIALLAAPHIGDLLFKVSPRDPEVFGGVALALVLVALVASFVPGVRATRVDPMVALRTE